MSTNPSASSTTTQFYANDAAIIPSTPLDPPPRLPKMPLKNNGRWIVDSDGLVVNVRGVNMINKLPPYTLSATGFGEDDAKILAAHGFNPTVTVQIVPIREA